MVDEVIAVGFSVKRMDVHLLCTEAGLTMIPPPLREQSYSPYDRYRGVFVALDKPNLVALRMMGALSERDVSGILKRVAEVSGELN